ncbi:MAG: cell division topological specificity factor MinE [Limnochordia bacterium]|jgi:cell division topological specificity factor|nr:cell division topological specificity factor MinE [Limnochordia bacterium]MDD4517205.1 cell division topological specificity factor MinE [Limnochordia bacterium]
MLEFLTRFFTKNSGSKDVAKKRLQLVLIQDRGGLSLEVIEQIKVDLIAAISKYVEIDDEALDVELEDSTECLTLMANIPIKGTRTSR